MLNLLERKFTRQQWHARAQSPKPKGNFVDAVLTQRIDKNGSVTAQEISQEWGCPVCWIGERLASLQHRRLIRHEGGGRYVAQQQEDDLRAKIVRLLQPLPEGEGLPINAIARHIESSPTYAQKLLRQLASGGVVEQIHRTSWGYRQPLTDEELATPDINWRYVAYLRQMEAQELRQASQGRRIDPFYQGAADRYIRCIHRFRASIPLRDEVAGKAIAAPSKLPKKTALPSRRMKEPWMPGVILKVAGSPAFSRDDEGEAVAHAFWESTGEPRWDGRRWHCYMRPLGSDRGYEERTLNRFRRTRWTIADYREDPRKVLADLKSEWV